MRFLTRDDSCNSCCVVTVLNSYSRFRHSGVLHLHASNTYACEGVISLWHLINVSTVLCVLTVSFFIGVAKIYRNFFSALHTQKKQSFRFPSPFLLRLHAHAKKNGRFDVANVQMHDLTRFCLNEFFDMPQAPADFNINKLNWIKFCSNYTVCHWIADWNDTELRVKRDSKCNSIPLCVRVVQLHYTCLNVFIDRSNTGIRGMFCDFTFLLGLHSVCIRRFFYRHEKNLFWRNELTNLWTSVFQF